MDARTNLYMAITSNHLEAVARLAKSTDLTKKDNNDVTAIQFAAREKKWLCVSAIAKNKRTDSKDEAHYGNALLLAVQDNEINCVRNLLEAGAPTSCTFLDDGDSCLHTAVRQKHPQMIALLLAFGADVTKTNNENLTPVQLGERLNTHCFSWGWTRYYNHEVTKIRAVLVVFAQAARQNHPLFLRIPFHVLELIFPYLSRDVLKETDEIESTITQLNIHRQKCEEEKQKSAIVSAASKFINEYGFFPPSSEASKKFMARLNNKDSTIIRSAVTSFVAESKKTQPKTLTKLLASDLYKLARS